MQNLFAIFKRELRGYFSTPLAYVFIVVFLVLMGVLTFNAGGFYDRRQADLQPFFQLHPWLYLFLMPAVSMRLWAEERKLGTIELLFTMPITMAQAVLAKFLAAWAFTGIALALTFPMWITVNYLGDPDNGVIVASYIGSFLMAGAFLAIGSFASSLTKNQVVAFVVAASLCLVSVFLAHPLVLDTLRGFTPPLLVDVALSFSLLAHFDSIVKGVLELRDIVFYLVLIGGFLFMNAAVIEVRKAD